MNVGALGEDRLLDQIFLHFLHGKSGRTFARAADDCAVVEISAGTKHLVLKTDCVVEGVHFVHGTNACRRRMESNDAPIERFCCDLSPAAVRTDHAHRPAENEELAG